jgi:hypothetical protein
LTGCGSSGTKLNANTTSTTAPRSASCGGPDEAFPVDTATGPAPDQSAVFADPPGAALRAFLDAGGDPGGGGFVWTGGEWLVLHRGDNVVVYGYRADRGFAYADADLKDGRWNVSRYGTCHPRVVGSSGWERDGEPDPSASHVLVRYFTQASCYPPGDPVPLDRVDVDESPTEVGLTLFLKPDDPPAGYTGAGCSGLETNPVERHTRVELKAPLGSRALLDYGAVPHAPPSSG